MGVRLKCIPISYRKRYNKLKEIGKNSIVVNIRKVPIYFVFNIPFTTFVAKFNHFL